MRGMCKRQPATNVHRSRPAIGLVRGVMLCGCVAGVVGVAGVVVWLAVRRLRKLSSHSIAPRIRATSSATCRGA